MFRVLLTAAVILLGASLLAGWAPGIIIGIPVTWYLASLLIAPKRKCRSCYGRGRHRDALGSAAVRHCWTCGGHKEYPRWGTRLLRPAVYAQITAGKHGKNF